MEDGWLIDLLFGGAIGARSRVLCWWSWCEAWIVFVVTQSGVGSGLAGLATAAAHVIVLSRGGELFSRTNRGMRWQVSQ
jgi:hypothetical protein